MGEPMAQVDTAAEAALAQSLREQIVERVKGQQQLVVVAVAVAAATISFASSQLNQHPEVMALLCLLYVGLSLALLRQDQEITLIADHLLDQHAFPTEAGSQARWELHKFTSMQASSVAALLSSSSQTMGNYGIPVLAVGASGYAVLRGSPNGLAWFILSVAMAFSLLFIVGAIDVVRRYRRLGEKAALLLAGGAR
jgi:hypothetical protein